MGETRPTIYYPILNLYFVLYHTPESQRLGIMHQKHLAEGSPDPLEEYPGCRPNRYIIIDTLTPAPVLGGNKKASIR